MNSATKISADSDFLQPRLNIEKKSRVSRLPWRGQFSPEFVEYILETALSNAKHIFDPFCGSGTVIYEAAFKGRTAVGTEVNPSAWHLAALASLARSTSSRIDSICIELDRIILELSNCGYSESSVRGILSSRSILEDTKKCLIACILLGMKNSADLNEKNVQYGATTVKKVLREVGIYKGGGECLLEDARHTSLETDTIDGVITSPPYINVFNYHQNYRPATELLGWNPLSAAKSEIGANRKHRQNRFLTVVQYCLDMAMVIDELARVCKKDATVVMVVGRESNILGTSFLNSKLIARLFNESHAFTFSNKAERVFTNRFGQEIYEDILVLNCIGKGYIPQDRARAIGVDALSSALSSAPSSAVDLLRLAINSAAKVLPSPKLDLKRPY
ncbi:DNA methyltransferase [Pseudomonas sp. REB1044]|uniref:DNA methyltransferase n=1 Tax=Pseudomonas sp. REB1044 TaxID=2675224 RepID=UPI00315C5960